ncbi:MAG: hypothetical protein ACP5UQ_04820, partial [Anaerolineae bacterium]
RTAEALLALISLTATLPADRRPMAERGMRKVRMSGVHAEPTIPATAWRALLSPVDGRGAQVIWFIASRPDSDRPTALVIVTADRAGIVAAASAEALPADDIPPTVPEGTLLAVPQPAGRRPLLLAGASFAAGRRAVYRALEQNWRAGQMPPLAYRFLSDQIWQYGPLDEATLAGPAVAADLERLGGDTAALLDHEAFADWFWPAEALYRAVADLPGRFPLTQEARGAVVRNLAETAFTADDVAAYRRRLDAMAKWLYDAHQETEAQLAATAAEQLRAAPPAASPFVQRLISRSLDLAALDIQFQARRARKPTMHRS